MIHPNKICTLVSLGLLAAFVCSVVKYEQQKLESRSTSLANDAVLDYELKRETINNQDVLYQFPPVGKIGEIEGVLFVAHGCSHSMTDWWSPTTSICDECIGLPEEKAIVHIARMQMKMIVISMSSINRNYKCWSTIDGPLVAEVMIELQNRFSKERNKIPLFAFGASSGGHFVSSILPKSLSGKLDGYICQIASPKGESYKIPSVFITMNRDTRTDKSVDKYEEKMTAQSIPIKHIRLPPLKMLPSFFTDRISNDTYDVEMSTKMIQSLTDANYIDKETLILVDNPRASNWRSILKEYVISSGDSLIADSSPLSEIMNVAYSQHEMSRDGVYDGLKFLLNAYANNQTLQKSS